MLFVVRPRVLLFCLLTGILIGCGAPEEESDFSLDGGALDIGTVDAVVDADLQDLASSPIDDAMPDGPLLSLDMGVVQPCTAPTEASGDYLMAMNLPGAPGLPLLFVTTVSTDLMSEPQTIQMSARPLGVDGTIIEVCTDPVGEGDICSSPIESERVELTAEGFFELPFGEVEVPGIANPLTGTNTRFELTLTGEIRSSNMICGSADGAFVSPTAEELDGTTVGLVRLDGDVVGQVRPMLRCPACPGGDAEAFLDEHPPVWPFDAQLTAEPLDVARVHLSWSLAVDESAISTYSIYQDGRRVAVVPSEVQSLHAGPLRPAQAYTFQVQAEDEFGHLSGDGPMVSITLADTTAPRFTADARLDIVQTAANDVRLSWPQATDDVNIAQYRVFQDNQAIADIDAPTQEFEVRDLREGTEYLFRVDALDDAGNSTVDGPLRAFVVQDQNGPVWAAGSRLWATEIGEESLRLNWDAATDIGGIRMYRVFQSGIEVALIGAPQLWVHLEGLDPDTPYDFEVIAEDLSGNQSAQPLSATMTTADETAPTWGPDSALVIRAVNGETATIGWSAARDRGRLAGYILYRDEIEVANVAADETESRVPNMSILTDYSFRVEAFDAAGNHSVDGPRLNVRLDDANPPVWPADARLSLAAVTPNSARINWSAAMDDVQVTGYEISIDGHVVTTTRPDRLNAEITPLTPLSVVNVLVTALDGSGNRADGPTLQIQIPDYPDPQWPADASVNARNVTADQVELNWSALPVSPEMSRYVVFQDDVQIAVVDFVTHSFLVEGLAPNTDFTFRIEILGPSDGISQGGPTVQVTTSDLDPPTWPLDAVIETSLLSETGVTLIWSALGPDQNVHRYAVYQDDNLVSSVLAPERRLRVVNLQAATTYTFRVDAVGPTGRVSVNGPQVIVDTPDRTAPVWPPGARINIGRVTRDSIELTWTAADDNAGVTGYRVQTESGLNWNTNVAALSAGQLMPATQYNFSVFALDGAGNLSLAPLTVAVPTADAAALTDREIFDGLSPACVACHGPGTHSPYFGSFAEFQRLIMNDPTIVVVGDPEASLLIRVLEGNGDPPWASMPLGALNYRQMSARGQTNLAMDELRVWIRAMGGL